MQTLPFIVIFIYLLQAHNRISQKKIFFFSFFLLLKVWFWLFGKLNYNGKKKKAKQDIFFQNSTQNSIQQHPPPIFSPDPGANRVVPEGTEAEGWEAILFLISPAMVKKASSTFVEFFALVSKNLTPISVAYDFIKKYKKRKEGREQVLKRLLLKRRRSHLSSICRNYFLRSQITFISNKEFVDILCCISFDFLKPLLHIVETFHICDIVHLFLKERRRRIEGIRGGKRGKILKIADV